jgi:hypothetical protein
MDGPPSEPAGENGPSRRVARRLRLRARERGYQLLAERDAFLEGELEPGEVVIARSHETPLVTDRRLIFGHRLLHPTPSGEWACESLRFTSVTSWALGRQHDKRPLPGPGNRETSKVALHGIDDRRRSAFRWSNGSARGLPGFPSSIGRLGRRRSRSPGSLGERSWRFWSWGARRRTRSGRVGTSRPDDRTPPS